MTAKCDRGIHLFFRLLNTAKVYEAPRYHSSTFVCKNQDQAIPCKRYSKLPVRIEVDRSTLTARPANIKCTTLVPKCPKDLKKTSSLEDVGSLLRSLLISRRTSVLERVKNSWRVLHTPVGKGTDESKKKSGFSMPWTKKAQAEGTGFQLPWKKKPQPKKSVFSLSLRRFPKKPKPPLGRRIKSVIINFIFKSMLTGAVLYGSLWIGVWGTVDETVELWSRIKSSIFQDVYSVGPIETKEIEAFVVRKYNENVRWAVCHLLTFTRSAYCSINYLLSSVSDALVQKYKEFRDKKDN